MCCLIPGGVQALLLPTPSWSQGCQRKMQCSQALEGAKLYSHREETARSAAVVGVRPPWPLGFPESQCRATGLLAPLCCLRTRTPPLPPWSLEYWSWGQAYGPWIDTHASEGQRNIHWAWNRERYPHTRWWVQARLCGFFISKIKKVFQVQAPFLRGQVGVKDYTREVLSHSLMESLYPQGHLAAGKSAIISAFQTGGRVKTKPPTLPLPHSWVISFPKCFESSAQALLLTTHWPSLSVRRAATQGENLGSKTQQWKGNWMLFRQQCLPISHRKSFLMPLLYQLLFVYVLQHCRRGKISPLPF